MRTCFMLQWLVVLFIFDVTAHQYEGTMSSWLTLKGRRTSFTVTKTSYGVFERHLQANDMETGAIGSSGLAKDTITIPVTDATTSDTKSAKLASSSDELSVPGATSASLSSTKSSSPGKPIDRSRQKWVKEVSYSFHAETSLQAQHAESSMSNTINIPLSLSQSQPSSITATLTNKPLQVTNVPSATAAETMAAPTPPPGKSHGNNGNSDRAAVAGKSHPSMKVVKTLVGSDGKEESLPSFGGPTQQDGSKEDDFTSSQLGATSSGINGYNKRIAVDKGDLPSPTSSKYTPDTDKATETKEDSTTGREDKRTKAETLSIEAMASQTGEVVAYVRGDPVLAGANGEDGDLWGESDLLEGNGGFDVRGDPLVIGGRKRGWQTGTQSGLYAKSSSFHNGLRFSACAAAVISTILLLVFHFEALDDRLICHLPNRSLWMPNMWEFVLYSQYIQQMSVISAMTLLKTPYFLWDFTDLFSWTNFLVYHPRDDSSTSEGDFRRRLTTIILGGLVGYGDRIGTNEANLLYNTCVGFATVIGIFLGIAFGIDLFSKWRRRHHQAANRDGVWRFLGLAVLLWFFSLLPLSTSASFEVSMEFKAQMLELRPLALAFVVVGIGICGAIIVIARVILYGTEHSLLSLRSRALWGAFYVDCTYAGRLFFLLGIALQICMGLCLGMLDDNKLKLVLLIALQIVLLVAVVLAKPFPSHSAFTKRATYAVCVLKLINFTLAFAFLPSSTLTLSGLFCIANAMIAINSLVIIFWCIRHIIMFGVVAVASAKRDLGGENTHDIERGLPAIALDKSGRHASLLEQYFEVRYVE